MSDYMMQHHEAPEAGGYYFGGDHEVTMLRRSPKDGAASYGTPTSSNGYASFAATPTPSSSTSDLPFSMSSTAQNSRPRAGDKRKASSTASSGGTSSLLTR